MEFKAFDAVFTPDPRSEGDLAARYSEMEPLALPHYVPADIRDYFDTTRLLWVHGHLAYPFFAWADLHARIAVERALRRRLGKDQERAGLGRLLRLAIERALLTDDGLAGFHQTIDFQLEQHQIEEEVYETMAFLDVQPEELPEIKSFVEALVVPFSNARNLAAHRGVAAQHIPQATKETIKLSRAIIVRLFRSTPQG